MGRTQIKFIGESLKEEKKTQKPIRQPRYRTVRGQPAEGTKSIPLAVQTEPTTQQDKRKKKLSAKKEKGVRVPGLKGGERIVEVSAEPLPAEPEEEVKSKKKKIKSKTRGRKYQASKAKIDSTKIYPIADAVKLAKESSYTKFDGSVELHLVTTKFVSTSTELPFSFGKTKKVEIATQQTIKRLEEGKIDFDILYSTAEFMPQLLPFAKLLGPRGLIPNPKSGTLIDNPSKIPPNQNNLILRTEKAANIVHTVVGKISQKEEEIISNIENVLKAVGPKQIKKATINATMGPAVKVAIK